MRNAPSIFIREMKAYFVSPIAYVVPMMFVLLTGIFFAGYFNDASRKGGIEASMQWVFYDMSITMLFVAPLITMRLFAEEKRSGTIEVLMTSPVTDSEVVIGKFAASLALFAIMLSLTFICPFFLITYSDPGIAPIAVGYLGLFLLGTACFSLGTVTSSITKNQIIAALVSFVILLALWLMGWVSRAMGAQLGELGEIFSFISLLEHFDDFSAGVLDTKHIVYYVSFTSFCLFLAVKSIQSAKWK